MPQFKIHNVSISGLSACVPRTKVSNQDITILNDSEKKLLIKTTGVESRRVAHPGLTTSDLCFEAADKLINNLEWKREDVDILIFLSQSPDYYLPATAIILQDKLGLSQNCMSFDISLGCSGYVYGLSVISGMMSSAGFKKGLLLVGDVSSATCSPEDKSTYPLFGDAGTATALEWNDQAPPISFQNHSDGSGHKAIMIPDGGLRNLISIDSFKHEEFEGGIKRSRLNLALDGLSVFNFSVTKVPKTIKSFFEWTNSTAEDYDYFVMHQANMLMNESIRKKLKFSPEQVPYSLKEFGNTSSASIPLTLVTELQKELTSESLNLLLSGFGVGLSWGVTSINVNSITCLDLLEI